MAIEKPQTMSSTPSLIVKQQSIVKQNIEPVPSNNEDIIMAIQKDRKRTTDQLKAFYLFGETEFNNCQHEFGFLKKMKNKPIPDECFGCPRLLDCFKLPKLSKKEKHELNTIL